MYLIGLATLVVFFYTPFAIVVLQEKSSILFPWDYRVILDTIADLAWNMILMVGFLLLPILFWESLSHNISWQNHIRLMLLVMFFAGIGAFLVAIMKIYRWLYNTVYEKSLLDYRTDKRLEYLKSLLDHEKPSVWTTQTWDKMREQPSVSTRKFVTEFLQQLNDIPEKEVDRLAVPMLDAFKHNLHSLNLEDARIYRKVLDWALEWSGIPESKEKTRTFFRLSASRLFPIMTKRSLSNNHDALARLFFKNMQDYLQKIASSDRAIFVQNIAPHLFDAFESNTDNKHMWRDFPPEWKINTQNLSNPDNQTYASAWLKAYRGWVSRSRLLTQTEQQNPYDNTHSEVLLNLFTDIHPDFWCEVFLLHQCIYQHRRDTEGLMVGVRQYIENKPVFNVLPRDLTMYAYTVDQPQSEQEYFSRLADEYMRQKQEALKIFKMVVIFPVLRKEDELGKLIKASKELRSKYKGNLEKHTRCNMVLEILEALKEPPQAD